jgi:hypothetical protein
MTTRRLLWVTIRRWYVVLLGLALTVGVCLAVRSAASTVYWSRTVVTVLQPHENPLHNEDSSLVGLASSLVIRANGGPVTTKTSSSETTLYGEGVIDGSRVRLRDVGSQWTSSIPDPVIYVEAVGPSEQVVADRVDAMVDALRTDLDTIQTDLAVDHRSLAFLQVTPERPTVTPVSGDRTRAVAASALLGLVLTAIALAFVDRRWPVPDRARAGAQSA